MTNMDIRPMLEIETSKPKVQSMEVSQRAIFDTGLTYNEAGYTYNTLGTAYGGIYGADGNSPKMDGR